MIRCDQECQSIQIRLALNRIKDCKGNLATVGLVLLQLLTKFLLQEPHRSRGNDGFDDDNKKAQRPGRRHTEEEPLIDEILEILPPEVSAFLIKVGKIIYPSLQLLNLRTDLEERGLHTVK